MVRVKSRLGTASAGLVLVLWVCVPMLLPFFGIWDMLAIKEMRNWECETGGSLLMMPHWWMTLTAPAKVMKVDQRSRCVTSMSSLSCTFTCTVLFNFFIVCWFWETNVLFNSLICTDERERERENENEHIYLIDVRVCRERERNRKREWACILLIRESVERERDREREHIHVFYWWERESYQLYRA